MFRPVLKVFLVCVFLFPGGLGCAQNPETEQKANLAGSAAKPAAETASNVDESSEPAKELQTDEADSLRFLLIPFFPKMPFKVESVTSDGSVRIRVQISEQMAQSLARSGISPGVAAAMMSQLTEGYFLGLSGMPKSDGMMVFEDIRRGNVAIDDVKVFRAQVLQVEEEGQAVVRIGAAAAEDLKKGDTFLLVRPAGSTTSQLQATPDLVSVVDGIAESTGMASRTASRLTRSTNNLKQIGLAMHNFHDVYKRFPPAVIYGPDGKPWHSWRVLLLPFMEQRALYDQYRFDEPWDGPNNKRLLEQVPPIYQDPIYGETEDAYTHYAVAVGKGTGFPPEGHKLSENPSRRMSLGSGRPAGARRLADFMDGSSNTLLVGSVSPERKIPWMKPEDVVFDEQFSGLGKEQGFASPYKTEKGSGGVFVFADGSVTTIRDDIDIELLRNLVQIADGQRIGDIPRLQPVRRSRSEQVLVLTIPRDKAGAPAKLTIEDLRPKEEVPGTAPATPSAPSPAADEAARNIQSTNNLKRFGVAIHNYHDVYTRFPPSYSTDKDGKPLLSWRVLVLPYVEQQTLYDQFRLDEPWDSKHNKELIAKMPSIFRPPNSKAELGKTNYLGVSGPQGIFPGQDKVAIRDVTDGTSMTVMIVEASDESAVIWTKPDDFVPDAKDPKKGVLGLWKGGFYACFTDGSVQRLKETIDNDTLRALFTRNGAEPLSQAGLGGFQLAPRSQVRVSPSPRVRPAPPATAARPSASRSREVAISEIKKLGGMSLTKGYKSSWSPDGTRVVFGLGAPGTNRDDSGGLSILDQKTARVSKLVAPGKDPAWSPGDGKLIAYVTGNGNAEELKVVEASGGKPRKLADGGFPTWSADGKTLFFHSRKQGKLMAVQVDAEKPEPTELMDISWWYPAISPDGKQVAYRSGRQVLVADIASGKVLKRWRFPGSARGFLAGWSTDGKRIGFGGYGGADAVGLWLVDVETGRGRRLAAGQFTMPDWSSDGSKVALDLRSSQGNEVWMFDAKALENLQFDESLVDRYTVPEGDVSELLKFIEDLKKFRPETPQERAEHQVKAQTTLRLAAERILAQDKDRWSKACQTALRVLLEIRIAKIPEGDRRQQEQTVEFVKTFLKAKLEKQLDTLDVNLAMAAARALETSRNLELAAKAYGQFAEQIAESGNTEFTKTVKQMKDAAKRLSDAER
ncbi:MAG: DUF1559 domain-containing protein [Pirellulaceae bacterium]|nr:DUF1559 domain-containing protein [Pirellulaceae bacterium]